MRAFITRALSISLFLSINSGCASLELVSTHNDRMVGSWKIKDNPNRPLILTFKNDQTFEVDFQADGAKDIWGRYLIIGDMIKFDDADEKCRSDCTEPGFFHYHIRGNRLDFDYLADACVPRKSILKWEWVREKSPKFCLTCAYPLPREEEKK